MNRPMLVLCIDDDAPMASLIQRWLQTKPRFTVEAVGTMTEALQRLRRPPTVNVLIVDLALPDSYGIDSVRTLVKEFPEVPVVVLSGADESTAGECIYAGAQDYLRKGDSLDGLDWALRKAVVRHEVRRDFQPVKQKVKEMQGVVQEMRQSLTDSTSTPERRQELP